MKRAKKGRPKIGKRVISGRKAFGRLIKKRLVDMGLKQYELAGMVGIAPKQLNHIISGLRPGTDYIRKISECLGIDYGKYAA